MNVFYLFNGSEFGGKIFPLKPVVKVLPKLFDHSDNTVREQVQYTVYAVEHVLLYMYIRKNAQLVCAC